MRRLREQGAAIPVIILSSRDDEAGKVAALDLGADDYVSKPFGVEELSARIRAALRHRLQQEGEKPLFKSGDLAVDLVRRIVMVRGAEVKLTPREYDLLRLLIAHAGKVLTHKFILKEVWGGETRCAISAHLYPHPAPEAGGRSRTAPADPDRAGRGLPAACRRRLKFSRAKIPSPKARISLYRRRERSWAHRPIHGGKTIIMSKRILSACALGASIAALLAAGASAAPGARTDWPNYGNDRGAMRYSPLTQITPANVTSLKVAWTYHMKPADATRIATSETTPLVVGNIMYLGSPYGHIVALDATTGKEIWDYKLPGNSRPAPRGIAYWPGDKDYAPELLFGTNDGKLVAIDVKTGQPAAKFGENGFVNLRTPEIMRGYDKNYALTSPPGIYQQSGA